MPSKAQRTLLTVFFTDVVRSTDLAREMGDARWREALSRHNAIVRRELSRHGGREIDTAGDGFFATFDSPAAAVRCAAAAVQGVRALGIEIRAGLHVGETEVAGKEVRGIAVHTGARVMAAAGAGEVLVTRGLWELVEGSGLGFEDLGMHSLKGVEGERQLFELKEIDGAPLPPALDPAEAKARRDAIQAPSFAAKAGRSRLVLIGAPALLVAIVATVVIASGSKDNGRHRPVAAPPGSLVKVDLATGKKQVTVTGLPTTRQPGGDLILIDESFVWTHEGGFVLKADREYGEDLGSVSAPGSVLGIGALDGLLWICTNFAIERATPDGDFVKPIRYPRFGCSNFETSQGLAWTVGNEQTGPTGGDESGRLMSFDIAQASITDTIAFEERACCVALDGDAVWVATDGWVHRLDGSGERVATVPGTPAVIDIESIGGRIWVLDNRAAVILVVDPRTNAPEVTFPPGGKGPIDLAVGADSLWVADEISGEATEIDPATRLVRRAIFIGPGLGAIAIDEETETLWARVYRIEDDSGGQR